MCVVSFFFLRVKRSVWRQRRASWSRKCATFRISWCRWLSRESTRRRRSSVSTGSVSLQVLSHVQSLISFNQTLLCSPTHRGSLERWEQPVWERVGLLASELLLESESTLEMNWTSRVFWVAVFFNWFYFFSPDSSFSLSSSSWHLSPIPFVSVLVKSRSLSLSGVFFFWLFFWHTNLSVCVFQALEEALNLHSPTSQAGMNLGEGVLNLRQQELHTQIAVLKEQVGLLFIGVNVKLIDAVHPEVSVSVLEVTQQSCFLLFVLSQHMTAG